MESEAFFLLDKDALRVGIVDDEFVAHTHAAQRREKENERARQRSMRLYALDGLERHSDQWRENLRREYQRKSGLIEQHMRSQIEDDVAEKLVGHDGTWPEDMSLLRSAYFREALYVESAYWIFAEDSRRDPTSKNNVDRTPDLYDAGHFRDAAYTDVLVTGDQTLAMLAKRTGLVPVWSLNDLLNYARAPHRATHPTTETRRRTNE